MWQKQISLGQMMPIGMLCLSNGNIAFFRLQEFETIFDQDEQGITVASFDMEDFDINGTVLKYDCQYNYKEIPELLEWLKSQQL
jgi:hypothetical protein